MIRPALATIVLPLVAIVATGITSVYYYVTNDVLRAVYWLIAFGLTWKWLGTIIDDTIHEYENQSKNSSDA